jgi:hypothetical protein
MKKSGPDGMGCGQNGDERGARLSRRTPSQAGKHGRQESGSRAGSQVEGKAKPAGRQAGRQKAKHTTERQTHKQTDCEKAGKQAGRKQNMALTGLPSEQAVYHLETS